MTCGWLAFLHILIYYNVYIYIYIYSIFIYYILSANYLIKSRRTYKNGSLFNKAKYQFPNDV